MIPKIEIDIENVKEKSFNSKTYYINFQSKKIEGFLIDEIECLKQAIYLMLNTEKYEYPIYKEYGFRFNDLINSEKEYFLAEIRPRIEECLLQDDRIQQVLSVDVKQKENSKDSFIVSVKILSNLKNDIIEVEKEVNNEL